MTLEAVDLVPVGLEIHRELDRFSKSLDRELSEGSRQTREGHVVVLGPKDVDDVEDPFVDSDSSSEFGLGEDEDGESERRNDEISRQSTRGVEAEQKRDVQRAEVVEMSTELS